MLTKELLSPNSIAVIGGSNDVEKPGGKVLKNILLLSIIFNPVSSYIW